MPPHPYSAAATIALPSLAPAFPHPFPHRRPFLPQPFQPAFPCHRTHYHCPPCRPGGGVRQWSADMCQMSPRTVTC